MRSSGPSACGGPTTTNGRRTLPTPLPRPLGIPPQKSVTSSVGSGKRTDELEIGKAIEDRKYPIKMFEKKTQPSNTVQRCRVMPDVCLALPRGLLLWKTNDMRANTMRYKRQYVKIRTLIA